MSTLVSRSPEDVLADLEDMERTSLVHEIEAGRFAFDHAIVRNTLLDTQSATRRALAHRRVAEALQQLQRSEHDELAHHWLLAGDESTADHHLELAAQRDLEALAYESAAERYQAVLDHQARRSVPDQLATARSWLGLGLAPRPT